MANVYNGLTIIQLWWWDEKAKKHTVVQIHAEEVSESDSQDVEKIFTCDSHDAQKISFGQCEYSIELKGVLPEHKSYINWIRERQRAGNPKLPKLFIYGYVDGKLATQSVYQDVYLTDNDRTNSKPFDIKFEALSRIYRNSQNKLY